jgi:hypothetical protein
MKRIIVIVEGQTEEEFVKEILGPFFRGHGLYDVRPIRIQTSVGRKVSGVHLSHKHLKNKGGFVNYEHLKNDALRYLKSERDIIVTTFVDFFRRPNNLPDAAACAKQPNTAAQADCLMEKMVADLPDPRFVPYIQLHEFEALLFSNNKGFAAYLPEVSKDTAQIVSHYKNPEEINSGSETAPSKRILSLFPSYEKNVDGPLLALEVSLAAMRERCPRFRLWLDRIVAAAKS